MGAKRTAWHFFFSILLRERGPCWVEVRPEVPLAKEPPRVDFLMLRRIGTPTDDSGKTLRRLWFWLPLFAIVELKSISHPYRRGDLDRLWSYIHSFLADADEANRPPTRNDLAGVLIVPKRTPSLLADLDAMALALRELDDGYSAIEGGMFRLLLIEIDVVAEDEDDDVLRLFGHHREHTVEARRFWARFVGSREADMAAQEMEDFDEVMQKLADMLTPEQRLRGLTLDQILSAVDPAELSQASMPERILLALPDVVLRGLSESYIDSLPASVRDAIRERLGR